jgi:Zn-dependent peptidase ImmA (M78 family)
LTGKDLVTLSRLNRIEIVMSSEPKRGMYYYADKRHTIVLSTQLDAKARSIVGWHEFAHFLQNFSDPKPFAAFSGVLPDKASEKLADTFAAIAVNPNRVRITGPVDFIKMIMRTKL